jgi:hypothetical protein
MSESFELTPRRRETLARLADALVPASEKMPSASAVGVAVTGVDLVLESRPDLRRVLASLLDALEGQAPQAAVARLELEDRDRFEALLVVVAGAYYMTPEVKLRIGYPGQEALPTDVMASLDAYINEGLLDPVVERGPVYREPGSRVALRHP